MTRRILAGLRFRFERFRIAWRFMRVLGFGLLEALRTAIKGARV